MTSTLGPFHRPRLRASGFPGDELVQDREGHVAEQGREDRPLRRAGVVVPQSAILTEDARLEERLDQRQNAFVPDPSAHAVQQGRVVDLVERSPVLLPVSRTFLRL
jgi:hypothetical protein